MDKAQQAAYKWLPTIGEWYRVVEPRLIAFEKLGDLKKFYDGIEDRNTDKGRPRFVLEKGTWILITNITLGEQGAVTYLEFFIRKDQYEQQDAHSQKLFFMPMFPPTFSDKEMDKWRTWQPLLKHVKEAHVRGT